MWSLRLRCVVGAAADADDDDDAGGGGGGGSSWPVYCYLQQIAVAVVRLSEKHPRTKTQTIPGPESHALLHMSPKAMKRKSQLNPKPLT